MRYTPVFLFCLLFSTPLFSGEIKFIREDWSAARKLAEAEKKVLLVDFYTDWCGWCEEMDKTTFKDSLVCAYINEHFIALKLDAEKGVGIQAAMKYRIAAFPTFGFYSPDGHMITKSLGYQKPEAYLATLRSAVEMNGKGQYYKGVSPVLELEFPEFYKTAYLGSGKMKWPDSIVVAGYLEGQKDLYSEQNFSIICRFTTSPRINQFLLDNRDRYAELYGREDVDQKIYSLVYDKLQESVAKKDTSLLESVMSMIDRYTTDRREENKLWYRSKYYEGTADWARYARIVEEGITGGHMDDNSINEAAWNIYEKSQDQGSVAMAIQWMQKVVVSSPSYANLDTYASLLFKDHQYQRAEEYALKAIDTGKANNEKVKATEDLLKKIRENLPKK